MRVPGPVVLISIDGLRPDGLEQAATPALDRLRERGAGTDAVRSVMPSVTLPCHMSMFHSVPPERHGITTNVWTPQVRPIAGLMDVAAAAGLSTAAFFNWEQLRDLWRPGAAGSLGFLRNCHQPAGDLEVAELAAAHLRREPPGLIFVYLGCVDVAGHDHGWMSAPYLAAVTTADRAIGRVLAALDGAEATVIVTSDHGGHDRTHGTDCPEDMTVPLIAAGPGIPAGRAIGDSSLLDLAPTIAALLACAAPSEWMGRPLFAP